MATVIGVGDVYKRQSTGNTEKHVRLIRDLGITGIACTPSYALYLAEVVERMGSVSYTHLPTTVLAYQHFQTFSERLKDFPCKVDYLSRARSAKDVSRIVKELADGKINILVGTHKIIGKSVKFKDLGLLIIDEEQKFGVSVKEKLRQMKVNVDTLTMTATPIPRTLQFSLMGARDLSVIQTPPPNRYPIQTEVHTFNEDIITEAINFEMSRNGQVFFVNNRIQNLVELESMIKRNIPDCRVCIGHGQMEPEKLEKIIFDFVNYDYDVLLATTIIESGIDIPNANTIIINQAQNFGLSDLHPVSYTHLSAIRHCPICSARFRLSGCACSTLL